MTRAPGIPGSIYTEIFRRHTVICVVCHIPYTDYADFEREFIRDIKTREGWVKIEGEWHCAGCAKAPRKMDDGSMGDFDWMQS